MKYHKNRILTSLFLLPATLLCIYSPLVSCDKKEIPVELDPTITSPDDQTIECEITGESVARAVFTGFSFDNIQYPNLLSVQNTFHQGMSTFHAAVVDWDMNLKTFSVEVVGYNVTPSLISGDFTFSYNNKAIETLPHTYQIKINDTPAIIGPATRIDEELLDSLGGATFSFGQFTCTNMEDIQTNLRVESDFQQSSAIFTTSVQFLDENTFNIKIQGRNLTKGSSFGKFTFIYKNKVLSKNVPKDSFQLIMDDFPVVHPPAPSTKDMFTYSDSGYVDYEGFRAVGIDNPNDIIPSVHFNDETLTSSISVQLRDWNPTARTFTLRLNINNPKCLIGARGGFTCTYLNQRVLTTGDDYTLNINVYIPTSYYNITSDSPSFNTLVGLLPEHTTIPQDYNAIQIPSWISKIADNAFNNLFNDATNSHVHYLHFPISSITKDIGKSAFAGDTAIRGEIILPHTLDAIEESAFDGAFNSLDKCSVQFMSGSQNFEIKDNAFKDAKLKNGISIPGNIKGLGNGCFSGTLIGGPITIPGSVTVVGENAFYQAQEVTMIDLSQYDNIPSWVANSTTPILEVTKSPIVSTGYVYLNKDLDDLTLDEFKNLLYQKCGLPSEWKIDYK